MTRMRSGVRLPLRPLRDPRFRRFQAQSERRRMRLGTHLGTHLHRREPWSRVRGSPRPRNFRPAFTPRETHLGRAGTAPAAWVAIRPFGLLLFMAKAIFGISTVTLWVLAMAVGFGWRPRVRERVGGSWREQRELERSAAEWSTHLRPDRDQHDGSSGSPDQESSGEH
jgi:hypothetical protein